MASVTYASETNDSLIRAAEEEAEDGLVRVRVGVQVASAGSYISWPGVSWIVRCEGAEEALELREAMRALFAAVQESGPRHVKELLEA